MKPGEKILNELSKNKEIRNDSIPNVKQPSKFINWYKKEIEWVEQQISEVEKRSKTYSTCQKGCNACCNLPIFINHIEAKAIAYFIKNSIRDRRKIKEQVINACREISKLDNSIIERLNKPFSKIEKEEIEFRKQYFNANIPCPMLNEEGACIIYPIRPTVCWAHKAYGDPTECKVSVEVSHAVYFESYEGMILNRIYISHFGKKNDTISLLPLKLKDLI